MPSRADLKPVEMDPRYHKVIDYYLLGNNKRLATKKAGFSEASFKDIFRRPEVIREIERRQKMSSYKADINRDWIIEKLKNFVEAEAPIEIDKKGRPFLNLNLLSGDLKKLIGKIIVHEKDKKVKYGRTERDTTYISVSDADKIAALKELSILLGFREEKSKLDIESNIIKSLQDRRMELANDQEDSPDEENKKTI
jgi:hypothetical protein